MIIKCDYCGKDFQRKPSHLKAKNYCCRECRHKASYTTLRCDCCGKEFEKLNAGGIFSHNFCSRECARVFTSQRMTAYNIEHNSEAMTYSRRQSIRKARLGKGNGRTYEKTFGRHTHRVVAERILGRPLKPGEVVHHINGDKRDNRIENLQVFSSQAEHARIHALNKRNAL